MPSSTIVSPDRTIAATRAWTVVGVIWVAFVLNYIDRQVAFSIFPVLRAELGFTNLQLGLVGSVFLWIYSLSSPFAGRLADIFRRERLLTGSLVLWSLATLGTSLSRSPAQFLLWRGVMGITEALYVPAALSVIGTLHPGPTRSRALAVYSTGQMTGIVLGGWLGGWFAATWGWRGGFVALAVSGIALAPVYRALLGDIPRAAPPGRTASNWTGVLSSRCYWSLAAAFFMLCVMLWMFYAWLPDFIYEHYRLSLARSGLLATAYMQAGTITGLLGGGWLGDRLAARVAPARFYIAGWGLLLAAPFGWLAFSGAPLGVLKVSALLFGIFSGFMIANVFAGAYDVIPARAYGFGGGALNMIGGLAGGAAMFAAGTWKSSFGPGQLMQWSSAAAGISGLVLLFVAARRFHADRLLLTRQ